MPIVRANDRMVEDVPDGGPCGPAQDCWISEPGGLTQFGAFIQILPPGSRSSTKHWHSSEDEMVLVLEGEVTVHEGDVSSVLHPGDAVTFPANTSVGHYLENRSSSPTRCLVVGITKICSLGAHIFDFLTLI